MKKIELATMEELEKVKEKVDTKVSKDGQEIKDQFYTKEEIQTNYFNKHDINDKLLTKLDMSEIERLKLNNVYNRDEINNLLKDKASKSEISNIDNVFFYTKFQADKMFYPKSAVDAKIQNIVTKESLEEKITKLNEEIEKKANKDQLTGNIDLSNYYNKSETDGKYNELKTKLDTIFTPSGTTLDASLFFTKEQILNSYYDKAYIDTNIVKKDEFTTLSTKVESKANNTDMEELQRKLDLKVNLSDLPGITGAGTPMMANDYYTKTDINGKVESINTSFEALKTQMTEGLNQRYTKSEVDHKVNELSEKIKSGTRGAALFSASSSGNVNLANYFNKEEINEKMNSLSSNESIQALKRELEEKINAKLDTSKAGTLNNDNFYDKSTVDSLLSAKLNTSDAHQLDNTNYYLKSETYNRTEVEEKLSKKANAEIYNDLSRDYNEKINKKLDIESFNETLKTLNKRMDTKMDESSVVNIENFYNKEAINNLLKNKADKGGTGLPESEINKLLEKKQDKLKPGRAVQIDPDGTISLMRDAYKAGDNIYIDEENRIHAKFIIAKPSELPSTTEAGDPSIPLPVTNVRSTLDESRQEATISWDLPSQEDKGNIAAVVLVKNAYRYPTSYTDGVKLYEGLDSSFVDNDLKPGNVHYYRIFVRNKFNIFNADGSQTTKFIVKKRFEKPEAPVLVKAYSRMIEIKSNPLYEYKINNGTWTTNPIFRGLLHDTEYTITQRVKETDVYYVSEESDALTVTTRGKLPSIFEVIYDSTNSNPETCLSYEGETANMTPGSEEWDEAFGYYPVLLKNKIERKLDPLDYSRFADDGSPADIKSGKEGDVMIAFPTMGYKLQWYGDKLHIWLTSERGKEDDGFTYEPFLTSSGKIVDKIYIAAYFASVTNDGFYSISDTEPTMKYFEESKSYMSRNKNGNGLVHIGFYQWTLLQILYIMKYKNFNHKITMGDYSNDQGTVTGSLNKKGLEFKINDRTVDKNTKLFGIENLVSWSRSFYIDKVVGISNVIYTNDYKYDRHNIWNFYSNNSGYFKKVIGTNKGGFIGCYSPGDTSSTTYFCASYGYSTGNDSDYAYVPSSQNMFSLSLPGRSSYLFNVRMMVYPQ